MDKRPPPSKETQKLIDDINSGKIGIGQKATPEQMKKAYSKIGNDIDLDDKDANPALQKVAYILARILDAVIIIMGIGFLFVAFWAYSIYKDYQSAGTINAIFQNKYFYYSLVYILGFCIVKFINSRLYRYHYK